MRENTLATEARAEYRARPYYGGEPDPGFMAGGFAQTRDSDPLEQSNHASALAAYRAAGVDARVDSFGHWAVGWIEYLTVPITAASVEVLAELTERVESYPVLDDDDYAEREWDANHPGDGRCYDQERTEWDACPCGLPQS